MVSAIVPVFNEEATIRNIVEVLESNKLIDEIIIVNDGSTDGTLKALSDTSAFIVDLPENGGKATALSAGVEVSKNDLLLFLDGDLLGLTSDNIDSILEPVIRGDEDMRVAVQGRKLFLKFREALPYFPLLGGQRALTKDVWNLVPSEYKKRFQIEIALNYFAKKAGKKIGYALIGNIHNVIKERKYGIFVGFWERIKMTIDIVIIFLKLYVF